MNLLVDSFSWFPFLCVSKLFKSFVEIKIRKESSLCIDIYEDDCVHNNFFNLFL